MKSIFAIPCPMPFTVGGENPLPPAMIETVLKDARPSLCRTASLSIRESHRATIGGLFGGFVVRRPGRDTQDRVVRPGCPQAANAQPRSIACSSQHAQAERHHGGAECAVDPMPCG